VTLIEVIITLGIITMISSIVLSNFYIDRYKINSFTKQLCSDIRYVRARNMSSDFSTYIYYKNEDNVISYVLREDGNDIKQVSLPKNTKLSYAISKIIFKQDGTINGIGETITVTYEGKKTEITIVPFSGRVLLKEGIYE
jgi:Tfp pilus assembly protein FimT